MTNLTLWGYGLQSPLKGLKGKEYCIKKEELAKESQLPPASSLVEQTKIIPEEITSPTINLEKKQHLWILYKLLQELKTM